MEPGRWKSRTIQPLNREPSTPGRWWRRKSQLKTISTNFNSLPIRRSRLRRPHSPMVWLTCSWWILDGYEKASGTVGPTNVNKVVEQQLVAGTYFVRISTNTDYSLLMLVGATFDAEDNDEFASAQDIAPATTVIGHIGSEYTTTSRALNLRDALAEAELLGGHLVTISDQAEQDLINELFPSGLYWMGITDEGHEGQWVWMTGEPVTYTNWGSGEPNNAGGDEHFAFTAVTGWNDVDEFEIHPGIIEMPDRDFYRVTLAADEALVLETLTPADTSGEFFNRFDPMIRVYDASHTLVAQDDNSATDGRNATMTFFGTPDTYFVEISASPKAGAQLTGQYVLTAQSKVVASPSCNTTGGHSC